MLIGVSEITNIMIVVIWVRKKQVVLCENKGTIHP